MHRIGYRAVILVIIKQVQINSVITLYPNAGKHFDMAVEIQVGGYATDAPHRKGCSGFDTDVGELA